MNEEERKEQEKKIQRVDKGGMNSDEERDVGLCRTEERL